MTEAMQKALLTLRSLIAKLWHRYINKAVNQFK